MYTDAVANMTMARQGFPRMAIGACYGGPLLSILLTTICLVLHVCYCSPSDGKVIDIMPE